MTKEKLILALQEAFAAGEEYGRDDGQGLVGSKSGEDAWDDFVKYWSDIDAANILSILSTVTEELDAAKAGLGADDEQQWPTKEEADRIRRSFNPV